MRTQSRRRIAAVGVVACAALGAGAAGVIAAQGGSDAQSAPAESVSAARVDGQGTEDVTLMKGAEQDVLLEQLRYVGSMDGVDYLVGPGVEPDTTCAVAVEAGATVTGCDPTSVFENKGGALMLRPGQGGDRQALLILPLGAGDASVLAGDTYRSDNGAVRFTVAAGTREVPLTLEGKTHSLKVPAVPERSQDPDFNAAAKAAQGETSSP